MLKIASAQKEKGFSLIEILVVIIIIGILAGIATAAYMHQRAKARDASLKQDLRNAASVIISSNITPAEFNTLVGKRTAVIIGVNSEHLLNTGTFWKDVPGLPQQTASEGTVLEVTMNNAPLNGTWERIHEEGEFCIAGSSQKSNFNYLPGSGLALNYTKYLFYDVKLGGIVTMDDLIKALNNNREMSCEGYIKRYLQVANP